MRIPILSAIISLITAGCGWKNDKIQTADAPGTAKSVHGFTLRMIDGKERPLADYRGRVMLLVNTASKCGLTPQYADLQALHEKYAERGLAILGFPANDFMGQEPGTEAEIAEFCALNYQVSFDMFAKLTVKGKEIHPLYRYLTEKSENGVFNAPVTWNFQKFLVDRQGRLVASFGPAVRMTNEAAITKIEALLAE
jgi:glutathione peroxidase